MAQNRSWSLGGGPDDETMHRLVDEERRTDTEIAELFGVARQTARHWRMRAGILEPAPSRRARRDRRYSHKDTVWWSVRKEHVNHPIRRRLVDYSLTKQGARIAPDAEGRLEEFLEFLEENDLVVAYDPDYAQYGLPEPFFFVPRDPAIDAPADIVRRTPNPDS